MEAKVIAISNQKGGVGKTTTAINLAAALGKLGKKSLVIDLDPQANATIGLGIDRSILLGDGDTIFDVLSKKSDIENTIKKSTAEGVDVVPSSINLSGFDLYANKNFSSNNELLLKESIENIKYRYNYIIIDCPPSLGLLVKNALVASNSVLITVQSEYYALEGLAQLINTIWSIKKLFNKKLKIEGVLMTMYNNNYNMSREIYNEVKRILGESLFKTKITRNIKLSESPSFGKSIFDYDDKSNGAENYLLLAQEVLNGR